MHEMSVVTSLLSIVREEMEKHDVHRLLLVRVRYGALSNIVPEALSTAPLLWQSTVSHSVHCGYHILPGVRVSLPSDVLAAAYV